MTLLNLAKTTRDPKVAAGLLDKAADLKSKVDELRSRPRSPWVARNCPLAPGRQNPFKRDAERLPCGKEREDLLGRRQLETASHINEWYRRPALNRPTPCLTKTSRVVCGGSLGQPCSLLAGEVGGFAALSFRSLLFAGSTVLL